MIVSPSSGHAFHREGQVRLMLQSLADLGLSESVKALEAESGYKLQDGAVAQLERHVLEGDWAAALELLPMMAWTDPARGHHEAGFLLMEHKYLEVLESGDVITLPRVYF